VGSCASSLPRLKRIPSYTLRRRDR
jgi:hypothetical protein